MSLYKELVENISFAIKSSLNEMAKKIDHRTVDRKLWLSVASVCSRNKETECEFIKPMKKLSKQDLLDRYVVGLIILKKPCPKSVNDIEKLKSFKLLGLRAIELGATIDEIKELYNINSGTSTQTDTRPAVKQIQNISKENNDKSVTPHTSRSPINKKYITKFDNITASITPNMYNDIPSTKYISVLDKVYKACHNDLEKYVKTYIRKSGGNLEQFINLIQDDVINLNKLINVSTSPLFVMCVSVGDTRRGYDNYSRYLHIDIDETSYKMYIHYESTSFHNNRSYDEKFEYENLLKSDLTKSPYWNSKPNILEALVEAVYKYIVRPYINWKKANKQAANAANSQNTLKKYNMLTEPIDYYTWMRTYIYKILDNNEKIQYRYVDEGRYGTNGIINKIYKYKSEYYADIVTYSGSTDRDATVHLSDILRDKSGYTYRYVDSNSMRYVRDSDDAIFRSSINNINKFCKEMYNAIKELIEKGVII